MSWDFTDEMCKCGHFWEQHADTDVQYAGACSVLDRFGKCKCSKYDRVTDDA